MVFRYTLTLSFNLLLYAKPKILTPLIENKNLQVTKSLKSSK